MASFAFALRPRALRARLASFRGSRGVWALAALSGSCLSVHAAPPEVAISRVAAGSAKVTTAGDVTAIRTSDRAIIHFSKLGVPEGSTLRFDQPSASSRVLGRITSKAPTQIDGSLLANGRVFLVNRAGIMFGRNAVVNVGALYAAAGDIADRDFLRGDLRFRTAPGGVVTNLGSINTDGTAALIGRQVLNVGNVRSSAGTVVFAAGPDVFVGENGSNVLVKMNGRAGPAGSTAPGVTNKGRASGRGVVFAASDALGAAILNQGVVSAPGGRVEMKAEAGVSIEAPVAVASEFGHAGSVSIDAGRAGHAEIKATIDATSSAAGGLGGSVEVSGAEIRLTGATIDASGAGGGGSVYFGGREFGGPGLPTARLAFVAEDAAIRADALDFGAGGRVVVFGSGLAQVDGSLTARGGLRGGDGGFIETSSRGALRLPTAPNVGVRSGDGAAGTWLIDPLSIRIVAGNGQTDIDGDGSGANPFVPTDPGASGAEFATLGADVITDALALGNVTVTTFPGVGAPGTGDIIVGAPILFSGPTTPAGEDRTLTLSAFNGITFERGVAATNLGGRAFTLVLQAGRGAGQAGAVRQVAVAPPPPPGPVDGGGSEQGRGEPGGGSGEAGSGGLGDGSGLGSGNPGINLGPTGALIISGGSVEATAGIVASSVTINNVAGSVKLSGVDAPGGVSFGNVGGPVTLAAPANADVVVGPSSINGLAAFTATGTGRVRGVAPGTLVSAGSIAVNSGSAAADAVSLLNLATSGPVSVNAANGGVILGSAQTTALTLGMITAGTSLNVITAGDLVNTGAISVTGGSAGATTATFVSQQGDVTLTGLNVARRISASASAAGGDISLTSTPGTAMDVASAAAGRSITLSAPTDTGAAVLGTLTTGALTAGTGATTIDLRADRMNLTGGDGSIQNQGGGGTLRIRPDSVARNVSIGGAAADDASTLGLSGAELLAFRDGFASVVIGSLDTANAVSGNYTFVGNATLRDPLTIGTTGAFGSSAAGNALTAAGPDPVTLTIRADNALPPPPGSTLVTNLSGVTVGPLTAGRAVRLGANGDATTLNLDQALIDLLSPTLATGTLTITGASVSLPAGALTFARPTTFDAGVGALSLTGNIAANGVSTAQVPSLTLRGGSLDLGGTITLADTNTVRLDSTGELNVNAAGTGAGMTLSQAEIDRIAGVSVSVSLDATGSVRAGGVNFGPRKVVVEEDKNLTDGIDFFEVTGNIDTLGAFFNVNRDAVLTADAAINVNRIENPVADAVRFGKTLISGPGGPYSLTINPGTRGNTTFIGNVGGTTTADFGSRLEQLAVTSSPGAPGEATVRVQAGLRAETVSLAGRSLELAGSTITATSAAADVSTNTVVLNAFGAEADPAARLINLTNATVRAQGPNAGEGGGVLVQATSGSGAAALGTINLQNATLRSQRVDGTVELRADVMTNAANAANAASIDAERVVLTTSSGTRPISIGSFNQPDALHVSDLLIQRVDAANLDLITIGDDARAGAVRFGNISTGGRNLRLLRAGANPEIAGIPDAGQNTVGVTTSGGSFTIGRFTDQLAGETSVPNDLRIADNSTLTINTAVPATSGGGAARVTGVTRGAAANTGESLVVRAGDGSGPAQDGAVQFDGSVTARSIDVRGGSVRFVDGFTAGVGGATLNATDDARRTLVQGAADSTSVSFIRFIGNAATERSLTASGGRITVERGDSAANGGNGAGNLLIGRTLPQGVVEPEDVTLASQDGTLDPSGISVAGATTLLNARTTLLTQGDAVTLTGAVNGTGGPDGAPEALAIDTQFNGAPTPGDVTLTSGVFGAGEAVNEQGLRSLRVVSADDLTVGAVRVSHDFRTSSADGSAARQTTGNIVATGHVEAGEIDLRTDDPALGFALDRTITLQRGFSTTRPAAAAPGQAGTANFVALTTTLEGPASTADQGVDFTGNAEVRAGAALTATNDDVRVLAHTIAPGTPNTGNLTANAPVTALAGNVTTDASLNANADVTARRNVSVGANLTVGGTLAVAIRSTGTGTDSGSVTVNGSSTFENDALLATAGSTASAAGTLSDVRLGDNANVDRVLIASGADVEIRTIDGNITINGPVTGTGTAATPVSNDRLVVNAGDSTGGNANGVVLFNGPVGAEANGAAADALQSLSVTGRDVAFNGDVGSQDGAASGVGDLWRVRAGEALAFRGDRYRAGSMDINFTSTGATAPHVATLADGLGSEFRTDGSDGLNLVGGIAGANAGTIMGESLTAVGETLLVDAGDAGAIRLGRIVGPTAEGITDVTIANATNAAVPIADADAVTVFGNGTLSSIDITGTLRATQEIRGDVTFEGRVISNRIDITVDTGPTGGPTNLADITLRQGFAVSDAAAASVYAAILNARQTTIAGQDSTSAKGINIIGEGLSTARVTATTGDFVVTSGSHTENAGLSASAGSVLVDGTLTANGGTTAAVDVWTGVDLNANAGVDAGNDISVGRNLNANALVDAVRNVKVFGDATIGAAGAAIRSTGTAGAGGTVDIDGSSTFNASGEITTAGDNGTITLGDSAADVITVGDGVSAVVETAAGAITINAGRIVGTGSDESLRIDAGTTTRRAVTISANVGMNNAGTAIDNPLTTLNVTGSTIGFTGVIGTGTSSDNGVVGSAGVDGVATFRALDGITFVNPAGTVAADAYFHAGVWSIDADTDLLNNASSNFVAHGRLVSDGDISINAAQSITLNQGFASGTGGEFTAGQTNFNNRASTSGANTQVNGTANVNASLSAGGGVGITNDANLSASVFAASGGVVVGDTTRFLQSTSIVSSGSGASISLGSDEATDRLLVADGRTATITANNGAITITGDTLGFNPVGGTGAGETLTVNAGTGAVRFNGGIGITLSPTETLDALETATITGGSVTVTRSIGREGANGIGVRTLTINAADGFTLNETFAQNPSTATHVHTIVASANTDGDADGVGTVNGRLIADRSLSLSGVSLLLARGFEASNADGALADDDFAAVLTAVDSTIRGRASSSQKGLLIDGNAVFEADVTTFNFGRTGLFGATTLQERALGLGVTGNTTLSDTDAANAGLTLATNGQTARFGDALTDSMLVRGGTAARVLTGNGTSAAPGTLGGDLLISGEILGESGQAGRTLLLSAAANTDTPTGAAPGALENAGAVTVNGLVGVIAGGAARPIDELRVIGRAATLAQGVGNSGAAGVEGNLFLTAQTASLGTAGESRWVSTGGSQDYNADVRLRGAKLSFRSQRGASGAPIVSDTFAVKFRRTLASDPAAAERTAVDLFSLGRIDFLGDVTRLGDFESQPGASDRVSYFADNGVLFGPSVTRFEAMRAVFRDHVTFAASAVLTFRTQPGSPGILEFRTTTGGPTGPNDSAISTWTTDLVIDAGGLVRFLDVVKGIKRIELGGINFEVGPEITVSDEILIKTDTVLRNDLRLGGNRITFQRTVNGSGLNLTIGDGTETTTFQGEVTNLGSFLSSNTGSTVLGANFTANNADLRNTLTFSAAGPYIMTVNQLGTFNAIEGNSADVTIRGQSLNFTNGGLNFGKLLITGLSPTASVAAQGAFSSGAGGAVIELPVTLTGDTSWTGTGAQVEFLQTITGNTPENTRFDFTFTGNASSLRLAGNAEGFERFTFTGNTADSNLLVNADLLTARDIDVTGDLRVQSRALGLGYNPELSGTADALFTESITITGNVLSFGSEPVRLRARAKTITVTGSIGTEERPVQSWEAFAIAGQDQQTTINEMVFLEAGEGADEAAIAVFRTPAQLNQGLRILRRPGTSSTIRRFAVLRFSKDLTLGGTISFDDALAGADDTYALSRMEFRGVLHLLSQGATIDLRGAGPGSQGVFFFGGVRNAEGVNRAPFTVLVNTTTPNTAQRWLKRRPTRSAAPNLDNNVELAFGPDGNLVVKDPRQFARVDYRDVIPVIAFGGDLGTADSRLGEVRLNVPNGLLPIAINEQGRFKAGSARKFREYVPKVASVWAGIFDDKKAVFHDAADGMDVNAVFDSVNPESALISFLPTLSTLAQTDPVTGRKAFADRSMFASRFIMGFNEKLSALGSLTIDSSQDAFLGDITSLGNLRVRAGAPATADARARQGDIYLLKRTEGALRTAFASRNGRGGKNNFEGESARPGQASPALESVFYDAPVATTSNAANPGATPIVLDTPLLDKGLDYVSGGSVIEFFGRIDSTPDVQSDSTSAPRPAVITPRARFASFGRANGAIAGTPVLLLRDNLDFNDPGNEPGRDHNAVALYRVYFSDLQAQPASPSDPEGNPRVVDSPTFDIVLDLTADGIANGANLTDLVGAFNDEFETDLAFNVTALNPAELEQFRVLGLNLRNAPEITRFDALVGRTVFNDAPTADPRANAPRTIVPGVSPSLQDVGMSVVTVDRISTLRAREFLDRYEQLKNDELPWKSVLDQLKKAEVRNGAEATAAALFTPGGDETLADAASMFEALRTLRDGLVAIGLTETEVDRAWIGVAREKLEVQIQQNFENRFPIETYRAWLRIRDGQSASADPRPAPSAPPDVPALNDDPASPQAHALPQPAPEAASPVPSGTPVGMR